MGAKKSPIEIALAKQKFIEAIGKGLGQDQALIEAGRSRSAYQEWRDTDPDFRNRIDGLRAGLRRADGMRKPVGEFPEFCERYLYQPLFRHQLQWLDVLEGRPPRDLHESQIYELGDPNYVLINCPPEHAKTTTLSINYSTYRVCADPNVRIILVSKTQDMAKTFLHAIKTRLTHVRYADLQTAFAPPGGWRSDATVWTSDRVYLGSERDSGEKDPTLQAIGIGAQVYGARADMIFIDDAVVLSNAHEYEKQIRWLQQECLTRLGPTGVLVVLGTRVDPIDLYAELRQPSRYPSGASPWTYLTQPAVLEYAEKPEDWNTLWPKSNEPWAKGLDRPDETGLWPKWDGRYLAKRRGVLAPRTWALAYMQASIDEDAVFRAEVVRRSVNGQRQPGVLVPGAVGHPPNGMEGLYVIGSMDPAMVGDTAVIVMAVDRHTKKRHVLQCVVQPRATPHWIRTTIKDLTDRFSIHEWRIEANAFQAFLVQDPDLHEQLGALGVRISAHQTTGRNKWDVDFGVASMAPIFEAGFFELPATHNSEATKQLIEQLMTWAPETKNKTDLVMALWFADIRAREVIKASAASRGETHYLPNRFLTANRRDRQMVVNLNDLAIAARR